MAMTGHEAMVQLLLLLFPLTILALVNARRVR
jgi:hypothetical protein